VNWNFIQLRWYLAFCPYSKTQTYNIAKQFVYACTCVCYVLLRLSKLLTDLHKLGPNVMLTEDTPSHIFLYIFLQLVINTDA